MTLIPAPDAEGKVRGVDGRTFQLANPGAVIAAWTRSRAITENHARVLAAPKGGRAPAFGWIESIRAAADGGIEFTPDWNARGEAAINGRDYRFLSPEFEHDGDGNILAVVGAGLTNDPNFPQLALNRENDDPEHPMSLKAIAAALGLPETADESACLTAINSLQQDKQTALNAAQTPDPTQWKPAAELNAALARATTAETALNAERAQGREAEIVALVDQAQADGKVIPATREYYLANCRADGGLERFKAALAAMPVIGAPPVNPGDKPPAGQAGQTALNADEQLICRQMGVTEEQYLAARA
ncbi:phage protease [Algiphilus sp. W345]|uniref:Phage protease n=1 Tax=Banduia mediterranea TaxID=3075609 RepID=A0ABU2WF71_9GAMM|nr:phage protease [Algiphilus sp. W345]MDT0496520.1 phage protease [Algiphilus sp. W345]